MQELDLTVSGIITLIFAFSGTALGQVVVSYLVTKNLTKVNNAGDLLNTYIDKVNDMKVLFEESKKEITNLKSEVLELKTGMTNMLNEYQEEVRTLTNEFRTTNSMLIKAFTSDSKLVSSGVAKEIQKIYDNGGEDI